MSMQNVILACSVMSFNDFSHTINQCFFDIVRSNIIELPVTSITSDRVLPPGGDMPKCKVLITLIGEDNVVCGCVFHRAGM